MRFVNYLILAVVIIAVILLISIQPQITGFATDPIGNNESGLVALWHVNEGTGSTTADSSGNGHTGTIYGATWVDGKFNKALKFNGVDNYIDVASIPALNEFTIEAWVNYSSLSPVYNTSGIVRRGGWGTKGFTFFVREDGFLYLDTFGNGSYSGIRTEQNILNNWVHVAVTYKSGVGKIYFNGVLQDTGSMPNYEPEAGGACIACPPSADWGANKYANATFDEIAIYNRALSDSEILNHYNIGMSGGAGNPTASTTASQTSGTSPLSVSFTCSGSGGTSPYTYSWTFGDGGTSTSQNPSHTYSAGTFSAICTVTDSASKTGTSSQTITATGVDTTAPTVSVSHSPSSPTTSISVILTATAIDNVGVTGINVYVDGASKKTCTSSPCSTTAQTYSLGTHTYYATASDAAGNSGRDPAPGTKSFTVINASSSCTNLTWLHVDGKYLKNECGQQLFLRGAAFPDLSWRTTFQGGVADRFNQYVKLTNGRANVIRVPMYPGPPEDFDLAVDELVNLATQNNVYIVLENHGGVDLTQNTTYYMNWYLHWVNKYKNNPTVVGIELWNEPYVDDTAFINYMTQATQTITAANPKLLIFVSSNSYWRIDPYWIQHPLPGNVVYTWDYYYMNWQPEVKQFYYNQQWSAAYNETYGWIDYVIGDALRANLPVLASEFGWYNDYAPVYPQYRSEPEWRHNMNDYMSVINNMDTNWYIWMWWDNPDHTGLANDSYSTLTPYGQIWAQYLVGTRPGNQTPPSCTESWSCGNWSSCVGGTQTRTCSDTNACGTTNSKPATSQSCTPPCTESWSCTDWSSCTNGSQARTCTDQNSCGTTNNKPTTSQSCQSCVESWTCGSWSNCIGSIQSRTCADGNNCGTTNDKPTTSQSCQSCVESWICTDWSTCSNNLQSRICTDQKSCGTTIYKPNESQSCQSNIVSPPAPSGGAGSGISFGGAAGIGGIASSGGQTETKTKEVSSKVAYVSGPLSFNYNLPLHKIELTAMFGLSNSKIVVEDLGTIIPNKTSPPGKIIYKFFEVDPTNIDRNSVSNIKIYFKVNSSYYPNNNIDATTTKLLRWNSTDWQELDTKKISTDNNYYYFESSTPGLSLFAISTAGPSIAQFTIDWSSLKLNNTSLEYVAIVVVFVLLLVILLKKRRKYY